jgi:choline dehydrogenase
MYTTDAASLLTAETQENPGLLTTEGRGQLTSNFAESGGFLRTDESLEAPDVQLHMIPARSPGRPSLGRPGSPSPAD